MNSVELESVARRHGVRLLVQFGSSVAGKTHARSDLDLGVLLEKVPKTVREHAELLSDLQRLFPESEVDLAILNRADPLFLRKVTEACRLLYGSTRDFQSFKIYAFKRYQDHRRYLELERRYVEEKFGAVRAR